MSSERIVFLDTKVFKDFKGTPFADSKILDVETHFKLTRTFQNAFSSYHPFSVKKSSVKEKHWACWEQTQSKQNSSHSTGSAYKPASHEKQAVNANLVQVFANGPIVPYRKDKSLKDFLVGAEIPSLDLTLNTYGVICGKEGDNLYK